jgi:hypothetical protein
MLHELVKCISISTNTISQDFEIILVKDSFYENS